MSLDIYLRGFIQGLLFPLCATLPSYIQACACDLVCILNGSLLLNLPHVANSICTAKTLTTFRFELDRYAGAYSYSELADPGRCMYYSNRRLPTTACHFPSCCYCVYHSHPSIPPSPRSPLGPMFPLPIHARQIQWSVRDEDKAL